ncbi:MAG TPA: hypothetical protein VKU00_11500, partial [Chthonomonadaceae bacterium]|nr:hypothetical protein [Chthonomonadaceae bacterium]
MKNSRTALIIAAVAFCFALIVFFRIRSQQGPVDSTKDTFVRGTDNGQKNSLTVAFLPVTCHLTCPVTDYASKTTTSDTRFDAMRFAEFPP